MRHYSIPVSYTHLDVYKRQALQCVLRVKDELFQRGESFLEDFRRVGARINKWFTNGIKPSNAVVNELKVVVVIEDEHCDFAFYEFPSLCATVNKEY